MPYDAPQARFVPLPELVERAMENMLDTETPRQRYVRQQWESAFAAARVALDALRDILPLDRDVMTSECLRAMRGALSHVERAYECLDGCSGEMMGEAMLDVLAGRITRHEQLEGALR